jgi:hypothetical protein
LRRGETARVLLASIAVLASVTMPGCGGSLRPATLLASARAAYPDCDDVSIAERDEGVRQWMVICGERRLFGLRDGEDIARERQRLGLSHDEPFEAILQDQSPPLRWSAAQRADDAAMSTSSLVARLRPLQVQVMLLRLGPESVYFALESPQPTLCATAPEIWTAGVRRVLASAPTESVIGPRHRFAQRLDLATLRQLASEPTEIAYCGRRYALDDDTAALLQAWAAR